MHVNYAHMKNTYNKHIGREESSKSEQDKKFVTYTIAETARQ